jgi:phage/plasmid-like protein (TIGR03299 family)
MRNTVLTVDVNERFAAERVSQMSAAADRRADIDRRVAEGKLVPLGNGRYRVSDPDSWDNGEVWTLQDGEVLPQHGLDTTTGTAALYTAVPAWHELGTVIPGGTTDIDRVLKLGGIDFEVTRRPVLYRTDPTDPNSPTRTLADQFVTVRADTGAGLGVVGARYEIFQNREIFEFLQHLVDKYDVIWESAGAMRDGRRAFVCLRLPDTVTIDAGGINDQIVPFIAAINSHDGSSQAQVVATPWRIVCGNTERFALRDAHTRWGVSHTHNWNTRGRVDEARRTLGLTVQYFEAFAAEQHALARTELALAEFRAVVHELWPAPDDDAPTRTKNSHARRLETLTCLYASNAERLGRTAYAAERAITEYADWKSAIRPTGSLRGNNLAARATAVLEGTADELKTRAHRRLLTLIRR